MAEFIELDIEVSRMMAEDRGKSFHWKLHVDGSSNTHGSRARIVILTPE